MSSTIAEKNTQRHYLSGPASAELLSMVDERFAQVARDLALGARWPTAFATNGCELLHQMDADIRFDLVLLQLFYFSLKRRLRLAQRDVEGN